MCDDIELVPSSDRDDEWLYASWRLHELTKPNKSGCWLWLGSVNSGYGVISIKGIRWYAHRLSWCCHHRCSIPAGQVIRHLCNTPLCVNPEHLHTGTQQQNVDDMHTANRQGYVRKLNQQQIADIRSSKLTLQQLADAYGVSKTTIHRVKKVDTQRK
jgi:uncharacterized protein YerC